MRSPTRRSRRPHVGARAALAALAAALLVAGCSSDDGGGDGGTTAASQEVFLQPVAAQGPDPFTESTAKAGAPPATPPSGTATAATNHEVTGSTPGLYGGTHSATSCDVERQVALLTADAPKARAFAEGAGIPEADLADWLRGLTPVVLRADTRVTNHGYSGGRATAYQSVLQAGTAVLVDRYGAPRVRCACGNPLRSPSAGRGAAQSGKPWSGYHPDRVVVIRPTATVVNSLVIVDVVDHTWIERRTGTDGDQDRKPAVDPPCDPDRCHRLLPPTPAPDPTTPDPEVSDPMSSDPMSPDPMSPDPTSPDPSSTTECPSPVPYESPSVPPGCPAPTWSEPASPPPSEQPVEPDSQPPSWEDLFPGDTAPRQPETFEG
ncbi:hypothetical protein GPZ77_29840 [Streptomyces sp. QHH-9511]|uniref:DUF6777 domain-containing protein n=1 Tax=Streptomyces sp. QHH-9511 TaxID=2684468 RepID=UPI001316EB74|nr:DUF6777 domain-containing protein [Streptomyces sp. QHH-9511]QGZ52006.1 hypothetical protein GPZ77_29840 [Streptomyces sp. QHH-9511]